LVLHFSDFSTIFYEFYKNQKNTYTICDSLFRPGPWNSLGFTQVLLLCTKTPGNIEEPAIGSLGVRPLAVPAGFRRGGGRGRWGEGGGDHVTHLAVDLRRLRKSGTPAAAAAAAPNPVKGRRVPSNERV
jgi:hypothetical protein